ncbi:hypothetical protein MLD63_16045 [Paracoccus sp. TK19116]|uniref:Uncharacterized protein n=1 Tax=Paracoccus albicereus TaxID=2922394 RepID=A0ABT1MUD3_9RHOB|nr:hypothetical protein [Paracoccus albicereus]MCQ0971935.1 hypothetical protein [Paracoccus albicereus]
MEKMTSHVDRDVPPCASAGATAQDRPASLAEDVIARIGQGSMPPDRARELGEFAYLHWLARLPGDESYSAQAQQALRSAAPAVPASPALGIFCEMLMASLARPIQPLRLTSCENAPSDARDKS